MAPKKNEEAMIDDDLYASLDAATAEHDPEDDLALSDDDWDKLTEAEKDAFETYGADDDDDDDIEDETPTTPAAATPAPAAQEPDPLDMVAKTTAALEELRQKRAETDAALDALSTELLDGELSDAEFNTKLKELTNTRDELTGKIAVGSASVNQVKEADTQRWDNACTTFLQANPVLNSDAHFDGFEKVVQSVTADPAIAKLPFEQQLAAAHRMYAARQEALGTPLEAAPARKQKAADPDPQPAAKRERPVPPTLAGLPAETIDPNNSPVAQLIARLESTDDPRVRESIMAQLPDHLADQVLMYG